MERRPDTEIILAELIEPARPSHLNEPYGVPRRFGIGTILIVTAAYGVLLALLRLAGWPPAATAWMLAFISLVGVGQMLLFRSKRPREASIVTGAVSLPLAVLGVAATEPGLDPAVPVFGLLCAVPFGGVAGYLAGGVVAGVFLVMDAVEQRLGRAMPGAPNGRRATTDGN